MITYTNNNYEFKVYDTFNKLHLVTPIRQNAVDYIVEQLGFKPINIITGRLVGGLFRIIPFDPVDLKRVIEIEEYNPKNDYSKFHKDDECLGYYFKEENKYKLNQLN